MSAKSILEMGTEELRNLNPKSIKTLLTKEELLHIVDVTDSFIMLPDPSDGYPKYHIKLKSGLCSNGFINLKLLLSEFPNLRRLFADQMIRKLISLFDGGYRPPDWVAGIPEAATELGRDVASLLGVEYLELKKDNSGRIVLEDRDAKLLLPGEDILIVEDLCTRGTGVSEAIREILSRRSDVNILNNILYVFNRGSLRSISVNWIGEFRIIALADIKISEYNPGTECPYCSNGSVPIPPKKPLENWLLLKEMIDNLV